MEIVKRVIRAYKRSFVKKLKRRSALDRYKSRLYYRRHKSSIRLQRKLYHRKNKVFLKSRKLFKRTKPTWMSKKPKVFKPKVYRSKNIKIKRIGKIYAPKRRSSK
jgi:hypothetical protein